jgi:DNA-binding beta-propeller fold protein YncE
LVFDISGGIAVLSRTITHTNSATIPPLSEPTGINVTNDLLYVVNSGNGSILVFNNASAIDGETTPGRAISGAGANLSNPTGVSVDPNADPDGNSANGTGVIYATTGNNAILVFTNASTADTKVADSGTSSGANTTTTLNDTTKSFTVDQFAGFTVDITGGSGQGQSRTITTNTATQLTVSPPWTTTPTNSSTYQIRPSLNPTGTISGAATTLSSPNGIFVDVNADPDANPGNGTGVLYAANSGNNSFVVFDNVSAATGNIPPDRTISDAGAPLSLPGGVALDATRDLLYVARAASIDIFENASAMQAVPIAQTVSLSPFSLIFPFAIAVDSTRDRLYAGSLDFILIYNNASALTGNPGPNGTINLDPGPVSGIPVGLSIDSIRDLLYVADSSDSSVKVYSNAGTSPTLLNQIDGIVGPRGVTVDSTRNILYVALTSSILSFDAASAAVGGIPPNRTITGVATGINAPQGIFVDPTNNLLYVANSGANSILVFNAASDADGNIAPDRAIAQGTDPVNETALNAPIGISVDTTR